MKNIGKKTILITVCLLLAVLSITYGVMVKATGSGTYFFVVWFGFGIIFILFAAAVKINLLDKIPVMLRRILIGAICVGICAFVIIEGCVVSGFFQHGRDNLDYIIVLGAQVRENGPSRVLKYRLDAAIEYLNKNPETICIVSGGQGYNEPFPEAVGMARYLKENKIPDSRIVLETESETTKQNIANSMEFIPEDASVGIVTNNFHVFRAVQTAKSVGLEDVCGIAAGTTTLYLPNNMLREFFGEIKYLLF